MIDKTPRYNLGVVIRETGIKPDTLRAWERRYGLPIPQRTDGGHRLYSEYDLETIKWLMARQDEGMRISNIVKHWQNMVQDGIDPLAEQQKPSQKEPSAGDLVTGMVLSELREKWVKACLAFDENTAEHILAQSFAIYPLETVCIEILQKGLSRIGQLWFENQASVQQEHFASSLAIRRINTLISAAPAPERRERIIVACVPGEDHSFVTLLLTLFLRHRGWYVVHLGQNVPLERMKQTIQAVNASLTILIAMQLDTAASLPELVDSLSDEQTSLAYGGYIFTLQPSMTQRISANYLGDNISEAPQVVERIMDSKAPAPIAVPLDEKFAQALNAFQNRTLSIEAQLLNHMQNEPSLKQFVEHADFHFSRKIMAALNFGDLNLVRRELDQMQMLTQHFGLSPDVLKQYLVAFAESARSSLDERGKLVIDWLKSILHVYAAEPAA